VVGLAVAFSRHWLSTKTKVPWVVSINDKLACLRRQALKRDANLAFWLGINPFLNWHSHWNFGNRSFGKCPGFNVNALLPHPVYPANDSVSGKAED
jgi:hypothetical protein